jgi:uncharacterized secreted protein with C-terminal beta-propeller domain
MTGLRTAAHNAVGGYRRYLAPLMNAAPQDGRAAAAAPDSAADQSAEQHSDTNVAEAGVDEPDLVKTDGRRIVTVHQGTLTVIDAKSRQVTGVLPLSDGGSDGNLLLFGDRLLVLLPYSSVEGIDGPRLLLVDLAGGTPRIRSSYAVDGRLLDARQVGSTVRVVVRSEPRLPYPAGANPGARPWQDELRDVVDRAGPDEWLPRYRMTGDGGTRTGRVDCTRVRRPAAYSGAGLLSLLTFDLAGADLGTGDPLTVVADGETVYATPTSLYVINGNQWWQWRTGGVAADGRPAFVQQTDVYQFDTSGTGSPRYIASGTVPGWVLNQYSLSEWHQDLRIAATINQTTSTVTVLRRAGGALTPVGKVEGLGHGERIYAVRFTGPIGYVVTFRRTDPLYALDLRDPVHPMVTGELKVNGYSAYLHPVGASRLIGVGQDADDRGRIKGLQVSLFDVADPAKPTRVARYQLPGTSSVAEFDPHAFLYWEPTGLLVIPVNTSALALRVSDSGLTEAGQLHPQTGQLLRSLVVGGTLWTLGSTGLQAADLATLAPQTRIGL